MAEKLQTPICEVSNLPLPVLSLEPREIGALSSGYNRHHHFHPETSSALRGMAGLAVRKSRIQTLPVPIHNAYHDIYEGPPLPDSENAAFQTSVLAAAGIVPRQAIDVRNPRNTVNLTPKAHERIASATSFEQRKPMAKFMARYCASQELDKMVDETLIEEFLSSTVDAPRRLSIARIMLAETLDFSLKEVNESHKNMKREGIILERRAPTPYAVTKGLIRRHALQDFADTATSRFATA